MLLDFNNLSSYQKLEIDKISHEIEKDFHNFIEVLFENNKDNIDLLFSNIISRNNDENSIFYNLCLFQLSLKLNQEGKLNKIITSKIEQTEILKQKIKNIDIITQKKNGVNFLSNIYKIIKNIHYVLKLKSCQNFKRKEKVKKLKKITLLEIFFIPKMFSNNIYHDRYYGNLLEEIDDNKKKNLIFFPIFFHKAIKKKFIKLAEKKINLILQSDYLKFEDYVNSITFFLRIKKLNLKNLVFKGFNIDNLVKCTINAEKLNQSTLIALLNYHCFKRMKEQKLNLKLIIDWYENQIVDKGFNYGKNIFFPKIKSKGFLGLNSILEINKNFIPSRFEIKRNLAPDEICLISPKYFEVLKKERSDINFTLAPALRSVNLLKEKFDLLPKKSNIEQFKILINFTGSYFDNLEMIELINKCKILQSKKIDLFIRPHQASDKKIFNKYLSKKINYQYSQIFFYDEMKNTDLLISRSSTACFESLIFGVPVLITRRKNSFLPTKIHKTFPDKLWFFSNDSYELEKNISRIMVDKTKYIVKSVDERKKLLSEYFYPTIKENISFFLK